MIPRPIPPGQRVDVGQKYEFPACDRCLREGSDSNPVLLSPERPSHNFRDAIKGRMRRDALCAECRQLLKGMR